MALDAPVSVTLESKTPNDEVKETKEDPNLSKDPVGGQEDNKTLNEVIKPLDRFDIILSGERSWMSHSVKLLPGEYFIFVDVSFDIPYLDAFQLSLPQDIGETPWLDMKVCL